MKNNNIVKHLEALKKNSTLCAPSEAVKLHVSTGNSKMGKVASVSLTPIYTCNNCSKCKYDCYALKSYQQYKKVRDAWDGNTVYANCMLLSFFDDLNKWVKRHKSFKLFRWHVAGDILNIDYFDAMIRTARENSGVTFWAFTKNYGAVNEWLANNGGVDAIPDNFSIIFSGGWGINVPNSYNLAECIVIDEAAAFPGGKNNFLCGGNCEECGICSHIKPGQRVYIVKH